jgi:hypothetical protein
MFWTLVGLNVSVEHGVLFHCETHYRIRSILNRLLSFFDSSWNPGRLKLLNLSIALVLVALFRV